MVGVLILTLGMLASIVAVPANIAVVSFVLGWLTSEPTASEQWPTPDIPVREIVIAWALATPLAIAAIRGGLRLVRRDRRLVLFLRRFGYDDAQSAVTFAVVRTIGASWRIVTLDDAEMTPVGVAAGTRRLFSAGGFTARHAIRLTQFLGVRTFPVLISAAWGVLALALLGPALDYLRTGRASWEPWGAALDPFVQILVSVFEGKPPLEYLGPTLAGVFAVLVMAVAVSFGVMVASVALLILALPLSTILFFASASADAVRAADANAATRPAVNSARDARDAAHRIARRNARVFGPRIVVLRVAASVWQDTVRELAAVVTLPLIDVSEPTDNVVWEIDELRQRFGDDCVFVGQHDRLVTMADRQGITAAESRLMDRLAGREVLAYTTDPAGLRRFARALRATLITRQLG